MASNLPTTDECRLTNTGETSQNKVCNCVCTYSMEKLPYQYSE